MIDAAPPSGTRNPPLDARSPSTKPTTAPMGSSGPTSVWSPRPGNTRRAASVRNLADAYDRPLASATRARRSRFMGRKRSIGPKAGQRREERREHAGRASERARWRSAATRLRRRRRPRTDASRSRPMVARGAVGRRVAAIDRSVAPDEAGARQIERHERRAHLAEGKERGAEVVDETQAACISARAHGAAEIGLRFEHRHRPPRARQVGGGDEPVRASANDDCVGHAPTCSTPSRSPRRRDDWHGGDGDGGGPARGQGHPARG